MKIIDTIWFTSMYFTIGIVIIENEMGERKAYMGTGSGTDEAADVKRISEWGAKLDLVALHRILGHLGRTFQL